MPVRRRLAAGTGSKSNVEAMASQLRENGCRIRGDVIEGQGGKQVLVEDPSGNLVELFRPK